MAFIVDASVTASWAFSDESSADASLALHLFRTESALVPSIWWFEVRNVLLISERRGRLTETDVSAFPDRLSQLPIQIEPLLPADAVFAIARTRRLTVYDAAYLELARRTGSRLATLDTALLRAAQAEDVPLVRAVH